MGQNMPIINDISQAQLVLESYISRSNSARHNLGRMKKLMNFLENPQECIKVIHIAGTSGKTSTAYYVAALLKAAGHSTGLTVSPHITRPSERAQINLSVLDDKEYCEKLGQFIDIIESSGIKPSYFELLVAFAFWIFQQYRVEYAVVEVGLGGLIDATNIVNRPDKTCVITDIGIDHIKKLGDTIPKIAIQKSGIIQPNNAVFMHRQDQNIVKIIKQRSDEKNAQLTVVDTGLTNEFQQLNLPEFQKRNLHLAAHVADFVISRDYRAELSLRNIQTAAGTHIPARMESIQLQDKMVILDGSHNEQKIGTLVESMTQSYPNRSINILLAIGVSEKYNLLEKMRLLRKISDKIILTSFDREQSGAKISIDPHVLSEFAKEAGFKNIIIERYADKALEILLSHTDDIGLVTGSFFLVSQIRPLVLEE
jgi:dihydrofolate synthase/folylpolyglutamate synthase